jgi:hypothetical protein
MSTFYFYPSTNRWPSLQGIGKPSWSLLLNLCLKFTAWPRDLTIICMCGIQRWGSHSKIMLNHYCIQSESMQFIMWLVKHIFTPELRLAITKWLNTYWLKTFWVLFFINLFQKIFHFDIEVMCVGLLHKMCKKSRGVNVFWRHCSKHIGFV